MVKDLKYPVEFNKKIPYLKDLLDTYTSEKHRKSQRNKLILFIKFLEMKYDIGILSAKFRHIKGYFEEINRRDIDKKSKERYRFVLDSYYELYKEIREKEFEDPTFINPVPSRNRFKFDKKRKSIDDIERRDDVLEDYEDVEKVLNYIYTVRPRLFIIVSLLLYTGARIKEVRRILIANIDLKERFFFCVIKGDNSGIYFFPRFFVRFLEEWIKYVKIEYPNSPFLFPSPANKNKALSSGTIRKRLYDVKNTLGLTCALNPHAFRDFINTERFDSNLNEKYRCILLNQSFGGVNPMHYLKKYKKRQNIKKKYDDTFPFPEFKPKLNLL